MGMHPAHMTQTLCLLAELHRELRADAPFERWLNHLASELHAALDATWMALRLLDEDHGLASIYVWNRGIPNSRPDSAPIHSLCDQVMNTGQSLVAAGDTFVPLHDENELPPPFHDKGQLHGMAVPLVDGTRTRGVLCMDRLFPDTVHPVQDVQVMRHIARCVQNASQVHSRMRQLWLRSDQVMHRTASASWPLNLLGTSSNIEELKRQVEVAAPTHMPLLILGESGTKKTALARTLHTLSSRRHGPFIRVKCTQPSSILELELCGSETSPPVQNSFCPQNVLTAADQGSLFLDHIQSLSHHLQGRLLRLLDPNTSENLAQSASRPNIRIIASSPLSLERIQDKGLLRSELYYRIARFPLIIPSLRERPEDIEPLLWHCLKHMSCEQSLLPTLTPGAINQLKAFSWPDNLRELETFAARLMLTFPGVRVTAKEVKKLLGYRPPSSQHQETQPVQNAPPMTLQDMEKKTIISALQRHQGRQSPAAQELGLSQRQLGYRIHKLGLRQAIQGMRRR